jgi:hypothetical protein
MPQALLPGKVRAVADPDRQRRRAQRLADLDALDVVRHRLRPDIGAGIGQRAMAIDRAWSAWSWKVFEFTASKPSPYCAASCRSAL